MAEKLKKAENARTVDALRKVLTFTGERTLKDLARDAVQTKGKIADIGGNLGKRISDAVKNAKLHGQAFALAVRCLRMEEGKRAIFLASFDHYREKLKLDEIKQGSLSFDEEEEGAEAAGAKAKTKAKNGGDKPAEPKTTPDGEPDLRPTNLKTGASDTSEAAVH